MALHGRQAGLPSAAALAPCTYETRELQHAAELDLLTRWRRADTALAGEMAQSEAMQGVLRTLIEQLDDACPAAGRLLALEGNRASRPPTGINIEQWLSDELASLPSTAAAIEALLPRHQGTAGAIALCGVLAQSSARARSSATSLDNMAETLVDASHTPAAQQAPTPQKPRDGPRRPRSGAALGPGARGTRTTPNREPTPRTHATPTEPSPHVPKGTHPARDRRRPTRAPRAGSGVRTAQTSRRNRPRPTRPRRGGHMPGRIRADRAASARTPNDRRSPTHGATGHCRGRPAPSLRPRQHRR